MTEKNEYTPINPNAVLFKTDRDELIICPVENGKFDGDHALKLSKDVSADFEDLLSNPFEFVFVEKSETVFKTANTKTTVPGNTFTKLFDDGLLTSTIENAYKELYG